MGASDHAIELFCIEYGCVLGLYSDPLHFEVELWALMNVLLYMWLRCCAFCNSFVVNLSLLMCLPRPTLRAKKRSCGVVETPATIFVICLSSLSTIMGGGGPPPFWTLCTTQSHRRQDRSIKLGTNLIPTPLGSSPGRFGQVSVNTTISNGQVLLH